MREPRNVARLLSLSLTLTGLMSWGLLPIHSSGWAVCAATRASLTRRTEGLASAASGRIAFVSDRDGNAEIYVMSPDGGNQTRLTFDPKTDSDPAWSPDGSRIAFVRFNGDPQGDQPSGEIYVMNADGSNQTRLTTSRNDSYPAWSPDGSKIAFSQYYFGRTFSDPGIHVMNADGSDQRLLTVGGQGGTFVYGYQPEWSPDGSKLAFINGNLNIHTINLDGSSLTQLSGPPLEGRMGDYDFGPSWSPDGAKIAFKRIVNCDTELICGGSQTWVINADGSGGKPVNSFTFTLVPADFLAPRWSPDGANIVLSLFASNRDDLFVMSIDGGGLTNITNTPNASEWAPSWHPLSLTGCVDSISPTSQSFEAGGGTGSVEVTADSECSWAATSSAGWISVAPAGGSGNGSVVYTVAANTSTSARTAGVIVANRIVTITQAPAPVKINSVSVVGKKLFVSGENFDSGAVILLNGEKQKTKNDEQNPRTALISKKTGKHIRPGDRVQVRNPDGTVSEEFTFKG